MDATPIYLSPTLRRIEVAHATEPLMERAGSAAARWAAELAAADSGALLILAGPGNNGGDAFAAARLLRNRFFDVRLVFCGDPSRLPADAAVARQRFLETGGVELDAIPDMPRWATVIDGLFGIGLVRAPDGPFARLIGDANRLAARDGCPLLALDCPSGLDADRGTAFFPAVRATHTLTFLAAKPGLFTGDGPDLCGEVRVASLEIDLPAESEPDGSTVGPAALAPWLRPRSLNTHKGTFGSAGVLGGSKSMVGAAILAGRAALKLGTGRVYVGLIDTEAPPVDLVQPELMIRRADSLLQAELTALACGPGLGSSGEALRLLEQALKCPLPVVLDADALNLLATDGRLEGNLYNRIAPAVMTPHPAEAARLLGVSVRDIQNDRIAAARALADRYRCCIALKGCGTVIAMPDGRWWINTSGNPGMASAGMGDVLTGLVVALLAQGWPVEAALIAGVHLHGGAADALVAAGTGPAGLTAGEVIDAARTLFNHWVAAAATPVR
jgi:hydroxyethylthiazole kinase-like uncharacterized protein yjeF